MSLGRAVDRGRSDVDPGGAIAALGKPGRDVAAPQPRSTIDRFPEASR